MQIYKTILVTMDCTAIDDVIIEHVQALALQNHAHVYLLHVVHSHTIDQERTLREQAEAWLDPRKEKLLAQGIDTDIVFRSGEPDREILKEIEEKNYDLVAMATHGHSFLGKILFGSVARTLRNKIGIPLLLIGPGR